MPLPDDHKERIAQRLAELRVQQEAGQAQLRSLDTRTKELRQTLQRIADAIVALEGVLNEN